MMVLGACSELLVKRRQDGRVLATCRFHNYHVCDNIWLYIASNLLNVPKFFCLFFHRFSAVNL